MGTHQDNNPTPDDTLCNLLRTLLQDHGHGFSLGVQGALAEFMRTANEPCEHRCKAQVQSVSTQRGALSIDCDLPLRVFAHEGISTGPGGWRQSLGLYLNASQAKREGRVSITELGLDQGALNAENSTDCLFDLGLGIPHVDVCVSMADPALLTHLRQHLGEPLLQANSTLVDILVKASPRRVFLSAASRIEVATPIPLDRSPDGPHTHLLPHRLGLPDADSAWVGEDLRCVLMVHPAHPCQDQQGRAQSFNVQRQTAFQALLQRYGPREYLDFKQQVVEILAQGGCSEDLPKATRPEQHTAVQVALCQIQVRTQASCGVSSNNRS